MDKCAITFYKAVARLEVALVKVLSGDRFSRGGNYITFADEKISKVLRKAVKRGLNADDVVGSCRELIGRLLGLQIVGISMPCNEAFRNSRKGSIFTITMTVKEQRIEPVRVKA
jgi:hypothetical protein